MKKQYLAGLIALVVGAVAISQTLAQDVEEKKDEAAAGHETPKWMSKTPAHAKLAKSVGMFDVATEFWMAPGAEAKKGKGTSKREMIMNGLWLQESFKMDWDGKPFEGRLTSGYDTVRGKLVNSWIDSMSPVMNVQYGVEKDGALVFTGEDPGMDGKLRKTKSTVEFEGEDKWVMTAYYVNADGDQMHRRLTYTRQK